MDIKHISATNKSFGNEYIRRSRKGANTIPRPIIVGYCLFISGTNRSLRIRRCFRPSINIFYMEALAAPLSLPKFLYIRP